MPEQEFFCSVRGANDFSKHTQEGKQTTQGAGALEFKPERWIDAKTGMLVAMTTFNFVPFGIGNNFSIMENKMIAAVLLSKFTMVRDPHSYV